MVAEHCGDHGKHSKFIFKCVSSIEEFEVARIEAIMGERYVDATK